MPGRDRLIEFQLCLAAIDRSSSDCAWPRSTARVPIVPGRDRLIEFRLCLAAMDWQISCVARAASLRRQVGLLADALDKHAAARLMNSTRLVQPDSEYIPP